MIVIAVCAVVGVLAVGADSLAEVLLLAACATAFALMFA